MTENVRKPLEIIVVDDIPMNLDMAKIVLERNLGNAVTSLPIRLNIVATQTKFWLP